MMKGLDKVKAENYSIEVTLLVSLAKAQAIAKVLDKALGEYAETSNPFYAKLEIVRKVEN